MYLTLFINSYYYKNIIKIIIIINILFDNNIINIITYYKKLVSLLNNYNKDLE